MNYYEVDFSFDKSVGQWQADLLKDDLLCIGFDSFVDSEQEKNVDFKGYCPQKDFKEEKLNNLLSEDKLKDSIKELTITLIVDKDWNEEWEKDVPSVKIKDFCFIHAPYKPHDDTVRYDLVISPKQSFGTANHPTTALIIEYLSEIEVKDKTVMDMGCGTGVLGILCKKMRASYVESIDNDPWAYNNSKDNINLNQVNDIVLKQGGSEMISKDQLFDLFIANINLNILLDNISQYAKHLKPNGLLLMSGFYKEDIDTLLASVKQYNLSLKSYKEKDNWVAVILQ